MHLHPDRHNTLPLALFRSLGFSLSDERSPNHSNNHHKQHISSVKLWAKSIPIRQSAHEMQTEEQMGGKSVDWGVREEHRVCVCDCYETNSTVWINKIRYLFINKFKLKWNCYRVQWFIESTVSSFFLFLSSLHLGFGSVCINMLSNSQQQQTEKTRDSFSCSCHSVVVVVSVWVPSEFCIFMLFVGDSFHFMFASLLFLPICYSFRHTQNRTGLRKKANERRESNVPKQQP